MNWLLFGLIFISPPFLKRWLLRWFCSASIAPRARIGWFSAVMGSRVELGPESAIRALTLIRVDDVVRLGSQSEISSLCLIYGASSFCMGARSYIGPQSLINADEEVLLGEGSALGPRSMVFTHGSYLPFTSGYWSTLAGVTIGDQVWCGAGVFIHPGVQIGDDTFVNARSVVTQSIPPGSIAEGNPADVIYPMDRMKRRMSPERWQAAVQHMVRGFARQHLSRDPRVTEIHEEPGLLSFLWRRRRYEIRTPSASVDGPGERAGEDGDRRVWRLTPHAPGAPPGSVLLSAAAPDRRERRIIGALTTYMRRYYGVRLCTLDAASSSRTQDRRTHQRTH